MKFKKIMYFACLSALVLGGQVVGADEIVAQPKAIIRQEQQSSSETEEKLSVSMKEKKAVLILSEEKIVFQKAVATFWSREDKSDAKEVAFERDEAGHFQAFIQREAIASEQIFVSVKAEAVDGTVYEVTDYQFEWRVSPEESTSSTVVSSTTVTSQATSPSTSTSQTSKSTSEPIRAISESASIAKGQITIKNQNVQAGTFDVIISNVSLSTGLKMVKVPVWTDENGQDDIRWYTAARQSDGTYKVTVHKKDHKNGVGLYHIHLYYENPAGKVQGVASTTTSLTTTTGNISIENINKTAGTFDVVVKSVAAPYAVQSVKVPVWTEENGQDDLKWYVATRQSDGSYKISISKKNHKNGTGVYHVHLYYAYTNGKTEGITATKTSLSTAPTGKLVINAFNSQTGSFDIIISQVGSSNAIQTVKVPVWTDENGQDDLKWYTATKQTDGTYKVTVQVHHHKNGKGLYHAHLYYQYTNGKLEGIASSQKIAVATRGKITISAVNQQPTGFDVLISDIESAKSISEIKVPVWSEVNGQDDLIWYTAKRQSNGTFKVSVQTSSHKNSMGIYHAHLYYRYQDGVMEGVGSTKVNLTQPKSQPKPITTTKKAVTTTRKPATTVQQPKTSPSRLTGTLKITNVNASSGTFDVIVSDVVAPKTISEVKIPIWTENKKQDDIIWYTAKKQANGTYKLTIHKKDHKNETGVYNVHLYYKYQDGSQTGVTAKQITLPLVNKTQEQPKVQKLNGIISFQNVNASQGTFDVIVSNISAPKEIASVKVPIWSEKNNQNDIIWYEAKRQSDGTYKVSVAAKDHLYETGYYQVHLYYLYKDGSQTGVTSARTQVTIQSNTPSAKIEIRDVDNTYGLFDVVVSNIFAPAGITKVEVPVWSDANGRGDLIWYEAAKQTDGTFRITVRLANHAYETGVYNAHLYVTSAGQRYGIASTTARVSYTQKSGNSFIDISSHNGALSVDDYRKLINQGVAGVVVKLTEGNSYFNPYAEGQIRNARAAGLRVSVYHYSHFVDAKTAKEEAQYFVAAAKRLGLPTNTVMVNDIEEQKTRANINSNMKEWENEMKRLGYHNLIHYTGASWIDKSGLGYAGPIKSDQFGMSNFWLAQYPYVNGMSVQQARSMALHARAAAWQFTSKARLLSGRSYFDLNIDYTGRFTN